MRLLLIGALAVSALAVQGCDRRGHDTVVVHDQPVVEKETTVVHDQPVVVHDDRDHHPGGPPPDRHFAPPPDRRP